MAYIYDLSDTWNAAGTTFFGIKMNVTNSASASGSKLLSLQVASTEYFGVDKNGNVTIGNGGDLRISSATGGDDSIIYNDAEDLYFNTNGAVRAVISSNGSMQLSVGGASNTHQFLYNESGGEIQLADSTGAGPILLDNSGGLARLLKVGSGSMAVGTTGAGFLRFQTSDTERMRINSDGNVGIGTSNIASLLHVKLSSNATEVYPSGTWAARVINAVDNSANNGLVVGNRWASTTSFVVDFGSIYGNNSGTWSSYYKIDGVGQHFWGVGAAGAEAMRLNASGNVGIGTSSPSDKLSVSDGTATFQFKPLGGSSIGYMGMRTNHALGFTTNDTERMRIDSSGNVGIGTSGPSGKLDVRGATGTTAIINSYNDSSSGNVASVFSNLQSNANSTSSYHYAGVTQGVNIWYLYGNGTSSWSSDQRLKKNIESTRDGYLDDLCQLRVVKYNWHTDADDKPRELGLIAQEVEAVFPGLVEEALQDIDDTGIRYKVLKGSVLPYMLLKALQEANAKIEALTARVAQLEGN